MAIMLATSLEDVCRGRIADADRGRGSMTALAANAEITGVFRVTG